MPLGLAERPRVLARWRVILGIRIDAKRALQRLRDFRFAYPSDWELEVLRAAVESDARRVTVTTDADDVHVEFDGTPFAEEVLRHLLERALEPGTTKEERRVRHFALGAAGALGIGAAFVRVESGGHVLTLSNDEVMVVASPKTPGTRLHLRKAFGWRVMTGLLHGAPERKAVASRAHRLPLALTLNGAQVTRRGATGVVLWLIVQL